MEYSLLYLQIFTLLCISSLALKGDKETRHNNCLTWRDDKSAVFLKCRVSNFFSPVTFLHEKSKTKVDCYIHDKAHYCIPKGKNITFNLHDSSITIVLIEKKLGSDLDGRWYCIQGESSKLTQVSLSKGIIIDSWVQIRGSNVFINGSEFIKIDCSSCRRPKNLHAEFIVNNETVASLWQIKDSDCRYGNINCTSSNICSCSQIGNMFSFSIQIQHVNTSTNLSCHMQFHDSLRRGTFSTMASHIYTGKDFEIMEFKTDVIKESTQIIDKDTQMSTKNTSTTYIMPSQRPPNMDSGETIQPEITTAIAMLLTAGTCFVVSSITFYCCRKQKLKNISKIRETKKTEPLAYGESNELSSLLVHEGKQCSYCALVSKNNPAEILCFDCRRLFCLDCNDLVHQISADMKFHWRRSYKLVPESLSLSFFECQTHEDALYQYFCDNHKTPCCQKCLELSHSNCLSLSFKDISTEQVLESICKLYLDLQSCADQLAAYRLSLLQSQIMFSAKLVCVKATIESTTNIPVQLDTREEASPSVGELFKSLNTFENEYNTDSARFIDEIDEWRTILLQNKSQLTFLESNAGKNQLTIAVFLFQGKLSEIKKNIELKSNSYYRQTVELETVNRTIVFRKFKLDCLEKLSDTKVGPESNAYTISVNQDSSAYKTPPIEVNICMSSTKGDTKSECQNDLHDGYANTEYLDHNNVSLCRPIKFVTPPLSIDGTDSLAISSTEHDEATERPKCNTFLKIPKPLSRASSGISVLSES